MTCLNFWEETSIFIILKYVLILLDLKYSVCIFFHVLVLFQNCRFNVEEWYALIRGERSPKQCEVKLAIILKFNHHINRILRWY